MTHDPRMPAFVAHSYTLRRSLDAFGDPRSIAVHVFSKVVLFAWRILIIFFYPSEDDQDRAGAGFV